MRRNLVGLERSTQLRSKAALERARNAIRRMQTDEQSINFRTVAAEAGVSTAWLYKTKLLRERIMKLRTVSKPIAENTGKDRRLISQERIIATLRLRVKELEAKNKELKEQLELPTASLYYDLQTINLHVVDMSTTCETAVQERNPLTTIDNSMSCHSRVSASLSSLMRAWIENSSATDNNGLHQAVVFDGRGQFFQLGLVEGLPGVGGGFKNMVDSDVLKLGCCLA